ncbi:MAG: coproporphyrinogen dehydrogenase HemZ, partial [Eubacteriales bacterium]
QQFFDAFAAARGAGFEINVDLIAGLPTETTDGFCAGLERIIELKPENLTIHTLYIKRAADYGLAHGAGLGQKEHALEVGRMLRRARTLCADAGLVPYYMYRQKNTVGNNENIGYAIEGRECVYNIWMMDDLVNVYGCGAGAMTKRIVSADDEGKTTICRTSNTKFAYNYIKDEKL